MSMINHLISRAKAEPSLREVTIRPKDVRKVAIHCQSTTSHLLGVPTIEAIESWIQEGSLRICGVPIRVLGQ